MNLITRTNGIIRSNSRKLTSVRLTLSPTVRKNTEINMYENFRRSSSMPFHLCFQTLTMLPEMYAPKAVERFSIEAMETSRS